MSKKAIIILIIGFILTIIISTCVTLSIVDKKYSSNNNDSKEEKKDEPIDYKEEVKKLCSLVDEEGNYNKKSYDRIVDYYSKNPQNMNDWDFLRGEKYCIFNYCYFFENSNKKLIHMYICKEDKYEVFPLEASNTKINSATVVDEIVDNDGYEYGYNLTDLDTDYFKKEYKKLKSILTKSTVDEQAYATQVAKIFVIDLFTLTDKINKYDVSSKIYFYSSKQDTFSKSVTDTIYSHMLDNSYGDRDQKLSIVKNVEVISTEKTKYYMEDKYVNAYLVKMNIYYEDIELDKAVSVVLVKEPDGKKISVVSIQSTLSNE